MHNALLKIVCLWLVCLPASAQVVKWVDERGVTHYGERAPQGRKGQEVQNKLANPPPSAGAASKAPSWQEQEQEFQGRRQQAEQAQQAEAKKQAQDANQRIACLNARDDLVRMKAATRMYKLNDKGERVYDSDQDREAAISRQEQLIASRCR